MIISLLSYLDLNLIRLRRQTEFYQPTYNPKKLPLWPTYPSKRNCQDRYEIISQHLPLDTKSRLDKKSQSNKNKSIKSVLDIGSQLGYFSIHLNQDFQLFTLGIDHDPHAIRYSQDLINLNHLENIAFAHTTLSPQTAISLPEVDLILFLDVFHHLVWHQGFSAADEIFRTISQKCRYLVFETGQSNESNQPWTESLSFMGKHPSNWLSNYLAQLNFTVIFQQQLPTHLTPTPRTLFICKYNQS